MTEHRFTFHPHNIVKALKCLKGARSTDLARPILTQYHFSVTGHEMVIEATDSYRLYVAKMQLTDSTMEHLGDMRKITDKLSFDVCVDGEWIDRWASLRLSSIDVVTWVVTPPVQGEWVPVAAPGVGKVVGQEMGSIEIINHYEQTSMKLALWPSGNYPHTKQLIPTTIQQDLPIRMSAKFLAHIFSSARAFNGFGWMDIQCLDPMKPCLFRTVSDRDVLTMVLMPLRAGDENTLNRVQPSDIGTAEETP